MKIRRYLGNDNQEAILKVKMDLGNEAIILNTRKVRQKGFFRLFSKPMIEVLAAVDESQKKEKSSGSSEMIKKDGIAYKEGSKIIELENKMNGIENTLKKIYEQILPQNQRPHTYTRVKTEEQQGYGKVMQLFYDNLLKNEVDQEAAKKIIESVIEKAGENAGVNDVVAAMHRIIAGILGKPLPIKLREDGKPTVVMLVGPTGVGKTTTLAKIAANFVLKENLKVGLITADTYRIAAVEQLKTYADILGIEVSVVYTPSEISELIKIHQDKDIILIDTAGRSHQNKEQLEELKSLTKVSNADETYLLMSTTTSMRNCRDILSGYSFLKDYKLLFTKLDESSLSGTIINAKFMTDKCLSYITTGQNVPDDIEVANIEKITKKLIGSIT